jgi:hypothetical protein
MTVYLDELLPDEALFSVIARYLRDGRVAGHREFLMDLLGPNFTLTVGMAGNLDWLAAETAVAWGISATEIRDRLTLHSYFAAISKARGGDALSFLNRPSGSQSLSGSIAGRLGLRHCEFCWRSDVAKGDPLYWRRTHQLPGVITCVTHRYPLNYSRSATSLHLARTAMQFDTGRSLVADGSPCQMEAHHGFASLGADVLYGRTDLSGFIDPGNLVDRARLAGYRAGEWVDIARLSSDLLAMFGMDFIKKVGIPSHTDAWIRRALLHSSITPAYAVRVLLLEYLLQDRINRTADSGTPVCPASPSANDREHRLAVRGMWKGCPHYFCSCGFSFLCRSRARSGRIELLPTPDGQDISSAAIILRTRGHSQPWIEHAFALGSGMATRLLEAPVSVSPWRRRTERAKHLVSWVELVDRCGDADAALAGDYRLWLSLGMLSRSLPGRLIPTDGIAMIGSRMTRTDIDI